MSVDHRESAPTAKTPAPTDDRDKRRVLKLTEPPMRGDDVAEVESRLVAHGETAVKPDSVYGEDTEDAVRRFQARSGLRVTGEVDAATRDALLAEPADAEPGQELFRLVALRAPEPPTQTQPRIAIEPPDGDESNGMPSLSLVVAHPTAAAGSVTVAGLDLAQLEQELRNRGDLWAPAEIRDFVKKTAKQDLKTIVADQSFVALRRALHAALLAGLTPSEGDLTFAPAGTPQERADLLRAVRLMALLEALADPAVAPVSARRVREFLRLATIVLPPSMRRPAANLARPPAVADLKVVRLGPPRYEPGAIAHIENVMATEKRERTHRRREETETTVVREQERVEENEDDLSTASQVQLQQETSETLRQETELEGGLHVSAAYGPTVKVDADARVARHDSKEEASRAAATYSTQITQRARQKVVERIREQRTTRQLLEVEETNLHSFTNTAPTAKHVVGVYRWVDQVQDAWIENYGKRLMLEFLVPEPAAVLRWALENAPKPDGPGPAPAEPANPADAAQPLSPEHIDASNYLQLVGKHRASGVTAPPPPSVEVSVSFKGEGDGDLYLFQDSKSIAVPKGYRATGWHAQCVTWGKSGPDHSWMVGVGDDVAPAENNTGSELRKHLSGTIAAEGGSILPIVMLGRGLINLAASVRVHCDRTAAELESWKVQVYGRIMDAYREQLEEWQAAVARAEAAEQAAGDSPLAGAASPEENRAVERRELRRGVIHMLLGGSPDEGMLAGDPVVSKNGGRPTLDLDVAAQERDIIAFFEQAFEWANLSAVHYPYYWADGDRWPQDIRLTGTDPLWSAFLTAGASRVSVPVRPGFEAAISLYLATGAIWSGGQVPTLGDPAYLGMAEEIAEALGTGQVPLDRTPLEPVRLPTSLVWLQPTPELNPAG
jgi:peptidoglycan hydrolase-like protein with peptidoglycan-binding domain